MKRMVWAVAACAVSAAAWAQDTAKPQAGADKTCGQKISEDAKYPIQLRDTLVAVANSNEQHARWVGEKSKAAKAEHDLLLKMASQARDMSKQADRMAKTMDSAKNLAEAPHDMQNVPQAMLTSMEKLRDEHRKFGQLLIQGADELDQRLSSMRGVGGAGEMGSQPSAPVEPPTAPAQPPSPPPAPSEAQTPSEAPPPMNP